MVDAANALGDGGQLTLNQIESVARWTRPTSLKAAKMEPKIKTAVLYYAWQEIQERKEDTEAEKFEPVQVTASELKAMYNTKRLNFYQVRRDYTLPQSTSEITGEAYLMKGVKAVGGQIVHTVSRQMCYLLQEPTDAFGLQKNVIQWGEQLFN